MSFSSGTFSINSAGQPVVTGTVISSTAFNLLTADLATGLSTCVLKDGTQTITANIPMSSFKLTGLAAGSAAGDSLRYEQGMQSILTTTGDIIVASAANTAARYAATATVAAHATTMDPWVARVVTLSGSAVTFTDITDADYVGQRVLLIMNAAHVWTDGAVFDVQGGATYTTAAGDWVELVATAVDAFDVTIITANGQTVLGSTGSTASTFTFDGAGGTTGSLTLQWQKSGNFVTLFLPAVQGTSGTGSTTLTSNTALDAAVRPTTAQELSSTANRNNGGIDGDKTASITIGTNGIITIKRDAAGAAYTNASSCGTSFATTLSYYLA